MPEAWAVNGGGEDALGAAQLAGLRGLLCEKQDSVRQQLAASKEDACPVALDLPIGRLTRIDALQQQQLAVARRQRLETQLAQIQQALSRLQTGIYGECVRCDEPIGYARLRVLPEAPFCLRCQGKD